MAKLSSSQRTAEISRLADVVSDLTTKVRGGGTRQEVQGWLAEQQDILKQIRALRQTTTHGNNLPALKRQRDESATNLQRTVQQRVSTGRRFGSLARVAGLDLHQLHQLHSTSFGQDLSFLTPGPRATEADVRAQQDMAMTEPAVALREIPRQQRAALQRNHELFETARELFEPDGIEDLLMQGINAQGDVDAIELATDKARDMLVPVRTKERPLVEQPRGPATIPPIGEVQQAVTDWYEKEKESNGRMRAMVAGTLNLVEWQQLMAPELPLRDREPGPIRSWLQRRGPEYFERSLGAPSFGIWGSVLGEGVRKLWESEEVQGAVKGVTDYVQGIRDEAATKIQEMTEAQELDFDRLEELDQRLADVRERQQAADPEDRGRFDAMVRSLTAARMVMGRRLSARDRTMQSYEAERAREELIINPDLLPKGEDNQDLAMAERDLEMMMSGLPAAAAAPPEPEPAAAAGRYTVQEGDTLSAIAQRFGTTVESLAAINDIANPDMISPGQVLSLTGAAQEGWVPRAARALFNLLPQPIQGWLTSVRDSPMVQRFLSNRFESQPGDTAHPRGIRNNNPGNIRHGSSKWDGMAAEQSDGAFVSFKLPEYGVQASAELFNSYENYYGWNTLAQKITYWAPPQVWDKDKREWVQENDTGAYIKSVARSMGLTLPANYEPRFQLLPAGADPGDYPDRIQRIARGPGNSRWQIVNDETPDIDSRDPVRMEDFLKAVYLHENGEQPYTDEQLLVGMAMARRGNQFPGLLERLPIYAEEGQMAQAPSIPAPGAAVRSGDGPAMVAPRDQAERDVADRYIGVRQKAVHRIRDVSLALGIKDPKWMEDVSTFTAKEVAWRAWELAGVLRQEGRDTVTNGMSMAKELDTLAWEMWEIDQDWWNVTGGASSFRGEGANRAPDRSI